MHHHDHGEHGHAHGHEHGHRPAASASVTPIRRGDHSFGQDRPQPGEVRSLVVFGLTVVTMVVEIAAGLLFGSMALLADGLHMGSHAIALGIAVLAYRYVRKHAHNPRFSFGTGKVNALAGFTGALLLVIFAVAMAAESTHRFLVPVAIDFDQAVLVAVVGLVVNLVSVVILGHHGPKGHHGGHGGAGGHAAHDHNLKSAYFHVLADSLTSLLAIAALLIGKYVGWVWMDPAMGILGAVLIVVWARTLLRATSAVLLDHQQEALAGEILQCVVAERPDVTVQDLHVWSIGPGIYAAELRIASGGHCDAEMLRALLPEDCGLVHLTVEVSCAHCQGE